MHTEVYFLLYGCMYAIYMYDIDNVIVHYVSLSVESYVLSCSMLGLFYVVLCIGVYVTYV